MCTGAVIDIAVEVLIIIVRADVEIGALADVLINVFASELVAIGIDMPVGVLVLVASVIGLEFAVLVSHGVDVLVDASTGKIVAASDVGVDMLADVDATVLAAVMTALKSIVPASLAKSAPFC